MQALLICQLTRLSALTRPTRGPLFFIDLFRERYSKNTEEEDAEGCDLIAKDRNGWLLEKPSIELKTVEDDAHLISIMIILCYPHGYVGISTGC